MIYIKNIRWKWIQMAD